MSNTPSCKSSPGDYISNTLATNDVENHSSPPMNHELGNAEGVTYRSTSRDVESIHTDYFNPGLLQDDVDSVFRFRQKYNVDMNVLLRRIWISTD